MRHIKVWFTAGMGFFTDAYDLFIIGAIISTIVNAYHYAGIDIKGFTDYLVYIPGVNTKGEWPSGLVFSRLQRFGRPL